MRAILFDRHGGPSVLRLARRPLPVAGPNEVLVRVAAIGVNPADAKWRAGLFADRLPLRMPHIPGYDVAGVVEKSDISEFPEGLRVAGMLDPRRHGA